MRVFRIVSWVILLGSLAPVLVVCVSAFTAGNFVLFPPDEWGVRWFPAVLRDDTFTDGLILSLQVAVTTGIVSTGLAIFASWSISYLGPGPRSRILNLLSGPLLVPLSVIGIASLIFWSTLGVARGFTTLAVGHIVFTLPHAARTIASGLESLDSRLEDAAVTLGASRLATLFRVILPNIAPAVVASFTFVALLSFDNVAVSLFLAAPGSTPLPVVIFSQVEQSLSPAVSAVSVIVVAVSILGLLLLSRLGGLDKILGADRQSGE